MFRGEMEGVGVERAVHAPTRSSIGRTIMLCFVLTTNKQTRACNTALLQPTLLLRRTFRLLFLVLSLSSLNKYGLLSARYNNSYYCLLTVNELAVTTLTHVVYDNL